MKVQNTFLRTNFFKVNNREAFDNLIKRIDSEDNIEVFEDSSDNTLVSIGSYAAINAILTDGSNDEIDYQISLEREIQKILVDNSIAVITEIINYELSYVGGAITAISKDYIKRVPLSEIAKAMESDIKEAQDTKELRELLKKSIKENV